MTIRSIELSSISTSYAKLFINPCTPFQASVDVANEPLISLAIKFCTTGGPAATELATQPDVKILSYLPLLSVEIVLPNGYPIQEHIFSAFARVYLGTRNQYS